VRTEAPNSLFFSNFIIVEFTLAIPLGPVKKFTDRRPKSARKNFGAKGASIFSPPRTRFLLSILAPKRPNFDIRKNSFIFRYSE
jgi:hypothetical protein